MTGKTIITGGAGFIGSHLATLLKHQGRRLLLIDNLSTGRRFNVEPLLDDPGDLLEADAGEAVRHPGLLDGVEEIYHLAAAVGVKLVVDDPPSMIRNNIDETTAVLETAAAAGARVLITSSSEVYGKCPVLPLREDMELVYGPTTASRWAYGLTKALDEHLAIDFHRRCGLGVVVVRLFNTIGPRQVGRYGMVVPRFVEQAVAGEPLQVYGDGKQTRAFCDVRDVVDAMPQLMAKDECHGRVFNLGSDREITINALAELVLNSTGSAAGTRHVSYAEAYGPDFEDPPRRLPDTSRIRSAIGFEPTIPLQQTIDELVALCRGDRGKNDPTTSTMGVGS